CPLCFNIRAFSEDRIMTHRWLLYCLLVLATPTARAALGRKPDPPPPPQDVKKADPIQSLADRIAALKEEHREREKQFYDELRRVRNDQEQVNKANQDYHEFNHRQAERLKALIREHGQDPVAFEGILVLVGELCYPLDDDLVRLVLQHHRADPRMGQLCM